MHLFVENWIPFERVQLRRWGFSLIKDICSGLLQKLSSKHCKQQLIWVLSTKVYTICLYHCMFLTCVNCSKLMKRCYCYSFTDYITQLNRYIDSDKRFQHILEACGVNRSLMKLGVKEGDSVIVGEVWWHCYIYCYWWHVSFSCGPST